MATAPAPAVPPQPAVGWQPHFTVVDDTAVKCHYCRGTYTLARTFGNLFAHLRTMHARVQFVLPDRIKAARKNGEMSQAEFESHQERRNQERQDRV